MKKQLILTLALVCPVVSISAETPGRLASMAQSIKDSGAYTYKVTGDALVSAKDGVTSAGLSVGGFAKNGWNATTSFIAGHCNRALLDDWKDKAFNFPGNSWTVIKENPKFTAAITIGAIAICFLGYKLGKKYQEKKKTA